MSHLPLRRLFALLSLVAVLFVGACSSGGSDDDEASTATSEQETSEDTATEDTGSDAASGGESAEFCAAAVELNTDRDVDEVEIFLALDDLRPLAPPEIEDELDLVSSSISDMDWNADRSSDRWDAVLLMMDDPEFAEAANALTTFVAEECSAG